MRRNTVFGRAVAIDALVVQEVNFTLQMKGKESLAISLPAVSAIRHICIVRILGLPAEASSD